ncbi:alpha/beta fold hydrolase [Frankia nepalensis]|uniref:alpha/beta fold hydrolase n=2 Tax=Frankia nepalensis TaxID=1836974 RepID=UPI0019343EA0|nr:alpha/beta hydrolase [Frankia nepalensis]MBL7512046.1 alpha/beta hydrolase [Frankia nepalensis]
MARFALIPGADGQAWHWHRVVPELRALGHTAVTMDYPTDPAAGLDRYADAAVDAIEAGGGEGPLVVVAQSLGGFIAPLVCARVDVDLLVLLNAMVPRPGESAQAWWDNVGHEAARAADAARAGRTPDADFDARVEFFHDVPARIVEEAFAGPPPHGPSETMFVEPWPLPAWPAVPTRFLQGRDDRFFPLAFQRRVVAERLGPTVPFDELPGGHLTALSQPAALAARLDTYQRELALARR